jgi:hypothetical protein
MKFRTWKKVIDWYFVCVYFFLKNCFAWMRNYQRPRNSLHNWRWREKEKDSRLLISKLCSYKTFHSSARLLFVCFFYFYLFFFLPGCSQFFLAGEEKILGDMDFGVCTHSFRANCEAILSWLCYNPPPFSSFVFYILPVRNFQVKN